jgi:N-acetylmuramoyl-L-alanine amidase
VGLWPARLPPAPAPGEAGALLTAIGYRADLPLAVLLGAFQRRWRPALVDGQADAETLARLAAVAALAAPP